MVSVQAIFAPCTKNNLPLIMIHFLHGPNTYSCQKRFKNIIFDFKKGQSEPLVFSYNFECEPDEFLSVLRGQLLGQSLFSSSKVFIFNNILTIVSAGTAKGIVAALKDSGAHEAKDVLVVFREDEIKVSKVPKGILSFVLKKPVQVEAFEQPTATEIKQLISSESQDRNMQLDSRMRQFVEFIIKNDPWKLKNIMDKLEAALDSGLGLDHELFHLLFPILEEPKVFDLIDALATKKIRMVLQLLSTWPEDLVKSLPLALWQFQILMKIKHLPPGSKIKDIHPYVFQKSSRAANNFSSDELGSIWEILYQSEIGLRMGKLDTPFVFDRVLLSL